MLCRSDRLVNGPFRTLTWPELDEQVVQAASLVQQSRASLDQSKATLSSNAGTFDSNAEILHLQDNVRVQSTKGYSADLSVATVNFKAGTVDSDKPVVVKLANGTINGNALSITKGGSTISFTGGVTSRFQRMPAAAPAPEATSGTQ